MPELKKGKVVLNCPKCGKEYNMDEYNKLEKGKPVPVVSVRGKAAPKEALREIAQRTGGILHEEHVDIFDDQVYDPRICRVCNTEFGYVKIVGKDKENIIYHIDLDLIEPKDVAD